MQLSKIIIIKGNVHEYTLALKPIETERLSGTQFYFVRFSTQRWDLWWVFLCAE